MGNASSQTNLASSEAHSKSIPNIRSLSDEAERFYFEQAISIQEQFSYEKSLRMQHQFTNTNSLSNNENIFHRNNTNFHLVNRIRSTPESTYSEKSLDCNHHRQKQRSNTISSHNSSTAGMNTLDSSSGSSCKNRSKKATRKLSKIFQKIGNNQNADNDQDSHNTVQKASRSANRKTAMTKSLVIPDSSRSKAAAAAATTARDFLAVRKAFNAEMEEVDLTSFEKNRLSIGTRLSCVDVNSTTRPSYLNINTCVLIDEKNQLGKAILNSLNLN